MSLNILLNQVIWQPHQRQINLAKPLLTTFELFQVARTPPRVTNSSATHCINDWVLVAWIDFCRFLHIDLSHEMNIL